MGDDRGKAWHDEEPGRDSLIARDAIETAKYYVELKKHKDAARAALRVIKRNTKQLEGKKAPANADLGELQHSRVSFDCQRRQPYGY